jgi:transposase-like protein
MGDYDITRLLMQVETGEGARFLTDWMRAHALQTFLRVMESEVEALCGSPYHPNASSGCRRAGSAPGSILDEGRAVAVRRPRVRRKTDDRIEELRLATYEAAREPGQLESMFLRALSAGVSTRSQKDICPGRSSSSKSSVSRLWVREGAKLLSEFRARDIRRDDWLILMLDGVHLGEDLCAVVSLGVAEDGTKHMLDFEIGASENEGVSTSLCERLWSRGFSPKAGCRLLCVFDGAKALRSAAKKVFGDPVFQRCLVHKERNVRRFLSKRHWGEMSGLMNRLRKVQGKKDAREALSDLKKFVGSKNAQALASIVEAGDDLIALHCLGVPNTLHANLLSTNIIENSIRTMRGTLGRVCRYRAETDQASRWLGLALTRAEKGFRKLAGYQDLPYLSTALKRKTGISDENGSTEIGSSEIMAPETVASSAG